MTAKGLRTSAAGLVIALTACGDDSAEVGIRVATADECPAGGVVVSEGSESYPVCNGLDTGIEGLQGPAGETGPSGAVGPPGPAGSPGANGTSGGSTDVIEGTVLCSATDNEAGVFLTAYVWVLDAGADSNDNIGMCSIAEVSPRHNETTPMIGPRCNLVSDTYGGVVTIDFTVSPPALGGAATGVLTCS